MRTRNIVLVVVVVGCLLICCCCSISIFTPTMFGSGFFGGRITAPTLTEIPVTPQDDLVVVPPQENPVTEAPQANPVPVVVTEPIACPGWEHGETRDLLPGQRALGDVVARHSGWNEAMTAYDVGGSGQGTIVANDSDKPISIYAEWGAGCLTGDIDTMINGEFVHGCGDPNGCKTVRVVTLSDRGTSVQFYP